MAKQPTERQAQVKLLNYFAGVAGDVARWAGMRPQGNGASIPLGMFRELDNVRFDGTDIRERGGQERYNTASQLTGIVQGIFAPEYVFRADPVEGDGVTGDCAEGYGIPVSSRLYGIGLTERVSYWDATNGNKRTAVIGVGVTCVYADTANNRILCGTADGKVYSLGPNSSVLTLVFTPDLPGWAPTGKIIHSIVSVGGSYFIGRELTKAGNFGSDVVVWDGVSATGGTRELEESGAASSTRFPLLIVYSGSVFAIYNSDYLGVSTDVTKFYVRTGPANWTAILWPIATANLKGVEDTVVVHGTDLWIFTTSNNGAGAVSGKLLKSGGGAPTIEHTIAVAASPQGIISYNGDLYYSYRDAPNHWIGKFSGAVFSDTFKAVTTAFPFIGVFQGEVFIFAIAGDSTNKRTTDFVTFTTVGTCMKLGTAHQMGAVL